MVDEFAKLREDIRGLHFIDGVFRRPPTRAQPRIHTWLLAASRG